MLDTKQLLSSVNANGLIGKMIGGMATKNFAAGLLAGGVGSHLLGKSDTVESIAKVGGMALLGTLAYKAYNNYNQQKLAGGNPTAVGAISQSAGDLFAQAKQLIANAQATTTAQAQQAALPAPSVNSELPLAIMRAMIAAAKADGHMDDAETGKIMGHMEQGGLDANEKMLLMRELANTPSVNNITASVQNAEEAAQVYLAALLVCDSQCANEQKFLSELGAAMKLDANFTANLQQELLAMQGSKAA